MGLALISNVSNFHLSQVRSFLSRYVAFDSYMGVSQVFITANEEANDIANNKSRPMDSPWNFIYPITPFEEKMAGNKIAGDFENIVYFTSMARTLSTRPNYP